MSDIYSKILEPEDLEQKMDKMREYSYSRGGGIFWIIGYWVLYGFFVYELISVQEKIDYMALGLIVFALLGIFLSYSVTKHLSLLGGYLKRKESEYNLLVNSFNNKTENIKSSFKTLYDYRNKLDTLEKKSLDNLWSIIHEGLLSDTEPNG